MAWKLVLPRSGGLLWQAGHINVPIVAAVLLGQLLEEVRPSGGGSGTKFYSVDARPLVQSADLGQLAGRQPRLVGIGQKEDHVRPQIERRRERLQMPRRAVGGDLLDVVTRQPLPLLVGEDHAG